MRKYGKELTNQTITTQELTSDTQVLKEDSNVTIIFKFGRGDEFKMVFFSSSGRSYDRSRLTMQSFCQNVIFFGIYREIYILQKILQLFERRSLDAVFRVPDRLPVCPFTSLLELLSPNWNTAILNPKGTFKIFNRKPFQLFLVQIILVKQKYVKFVHI